MYVLSIVNVNHLNVDAVHLTSFVEWSVGASLIPRAEQNALNSPFTFWRRNWCEIAFVSLFKCWQPGHWGRRFCRFNPLIATFLWINSETKAPNLNCLAYQHKHINWPMRWARQWWHQRSGRFSSLRRRPHNPSPSDIILLAPSKQKVNNSHQRSRRNCFCDWEVKEFPKEKPKFDSPPSHNAFWLELPLTPVVYFQSTCECTAWKLKQTAQISLW